MNATPLKQKSWTGAARLCLACLLLGLATFSGLAQTGTQREYEIKAAVLFNVLKYVEWPGNSASTNPVPLQIGLLGQLPYPHALTVLDGKTIQGRKLVVKPISAAEAQSCQVVYVGASEKSKCPEIISELKGKPILTVSEVDGFAQRGGMVNLIAEGNRVAMEINRESATQAGLSISSQLLRVAKVFPR